MFTILLIVIIIGVIYSVSQEDKAKNTRLFGGLLLAISSAFLLLNILDN
jgi:hypothetical membrane protein